ncbi:hypothetical protein [Ralstonia wenshanensis]|uniref:hypothetical protein n=1 Tax=Ralstonia wenshanensis TaxID=2842456 RepID=UPI0039C64D0F
MRKERPILFSGEMVRAILDGRKTQTRRALRVQPPAQTVSVRTYHHPDPRTHFWAADRSDSLLDWAQPCPYGDVGDRLWVRETWQHSNHPFGPYESSCMVFHRADYLDDPLGPDLERSADGIRRQWRPSIHMPRSACRLVLEIIGVRVERLQDISGDDAVCEGIEAQRSAFGTAWRCYTSAHPAGSWYPEGKGTAPILSYGSLWEKINGAATWAANPWVWVVEFKILEAR